MSFLLTFIFVFLVLQKSFEFSFVIQNPSFTAINGKQDKLTFDTTPTSGSTNLVTSGGVYTAINDLKSTTFFKIPIADKWSSQSIHPPYYASGTMPAYVSCLSSGKIVSERLYETISWAQNTASRNHLCENTSTLDVSPIIDTLIDYFSPIEDGTYAISIYSILFGGGSTFLGPVGYFEATIQSNSVVSYTEPTGNTWFKNVDSPFYYFGLSYIYKK